MICDPKTDCFAYDKECHDCRALNGLYCRTEGRCAFYKKESDCVNAEGTNGYYKYRLQQYFDEHFGQFADEADFFPDPAFNTWEFFIPSKCEIVKLKCSSVGRVSVLRKKVSMKNGN